MEKTDTFALDTGMARSDYQELQELTGFWRTNTYSKPAALYVHLLLSSPVDATLVSDLDEPDSGDGYAPVQSNPGDTRWALTSSTAGVVYNNTTLTFGPATDDWGLITHVCVSDGTYVRFYQALTSSRTILSGDSVIFAVGEVTMTLQ